MRKPSEATQLRAARREVKSLQDTLAALRGSENSYRVRATRAETEVAEWKRRFDDLLKLSIVEASVNRTES